MSTSTVTARYHINPQTGNPGVCRAQYNCRFGSIDREHYDSKEEARAAFEKKMEVSTRDMGKAVTSLKSKIVTDQGNLDFDYIGFSAKAIDEWPKPWTQEERENFLKVEELSELLEGPMDEKKWEEAQKIRYSMHPYIPPVRYSNPFSFSSSNKDDEWKSRSKCLPQLADDLMIRREAMDYVPMDAPPRDKSDRMMGLEDARIRAVKGYNEPKYDHRPTEVYVQDNVEDYIDQTLDRVVAGETYELKRSRKEPHVSLVPNRDRLMTLVSDPDSDKFYNKLYLSTVFPERELKDSFDRAGVDNVSVSNYENGREWGLAYTVMEPSGDSRTFSVYEHRNTDSIIINAKTNWKHGDLPMAGESKNDFIAEFSPNDHRQAADALTFFIKEAQKGELAPDDTLVKQVSRRDWRAILSESVPGYKDWADKIDPRDDEDDDPLKRLGF